MSSSFSPSLIEVFLIYAHIHLRCTVWWADTHIHCKMIIKTILTPSFLHIIISVCVGGWWWHLRPILLTGLKYVIQLILVTMLPIKPLEFIHLSQEGVHCFISPPLLPRPRQPLIYCLFLWVQLFFYYKHFILEKFTGKLGRAQISLYPSPRYPKFNILYNHGTYIKSKKLTLVQYYLLNYKLL